MSLRGHGSSTWKTIPVRMDTNDRSNRDFCLDIWGQKDCVSLSRPGHIFLELFRLLILLALLPGAQSNVEAHAKAVHFLQLRSSHSRNEMDSFVVQQR